MATRSNIEKLGLKIKITLMMITSYVVLSETAFILFRWQQVEQNDFHFFFNIKYVLIKNVSKQFSQFRIVRVYVLLTCFCTR
jgi:hypothetical protein